MNRDLLLELDKQKLNGPMRRGCWSRNGSRLLPPAAAPALRATRLSDRSAVSRHAYTLHLIDGACAYASDNWLQRGPDLPLRGFDAAPPG